MEQRITRWHAKLLKQLINPSSDAIWIWWSNKHFWNRELVAALAKVSRRNHETMLPAATSKEPSFLPLFASFCHRGGPNGEKGTLARVVHEQEMHIAVVPLDVARHWRRGRGRHSAWPTRAHRIVQLDMCGPDITEARSFSGLACELSSPAVGVAQSLLSQWGGVSVCVCGVIWRFAHGSWGVRWHHDQCELA